MTEKNETNTDNKPDNLSISKSGISSTINDLAWTKNLNLPGKDRHLMPAIPTKSGRVRDAENPGFYPFCTLPITDAERMLLLKQFQQLIKQNFIDQGAKAEKRA